MYSIVFPVPSGDSGHQKSSSVLLLLLTFTLSISHSGCVRAAPLQKFSLERALSTALENNRLKSISQKSVQIAEQQYQQAVSAQWPSLSLNASFQRRDQGPTFEYPAQSFNLNLNSPVPPIEVPAQELPLLGRDTALYSLQAMYPIYTGGKLSSVIKQARLGKDIATTEARRTDLQIVQDVKRYYYASIYTAQLRNLAEEISISFKVLADITETFYLGGSNSVNKLDFLQSKLALSLAQSTHADLKAKHQSALAALSFSMGLPWQDNIQITQHYYPQDLTPDNLESLIQQAQKFNPELHKLTLAVDAYQAKIDEEKSANYPTLAMFASVDAFNNDLDGGLSNDSNNHSWTVGIGMQVELLNGGMTRRKIAAANIKLSQVHDQRFLMNEAVAAQVKNLFLAINAVQQQLAITESAVQISHDNLDLSKRAYQTGAVKTEKVIEANLSDALIRAKHYRALHDQALHLAETAYLLGKETVQ